MGETKKIIISGFLACAFAGAAMSQMDSLNKYARERFFTPGRMAILPFSIFPSETGKFLYETIQQFEFMRENGIGDRDNKLPDTNYRAFRV